jgi:hypothetical protein
MKNQATENTQAAQKKRNYLTQNKTKTKQKTKT